MGRWGGQGGTVSQQEAVLESRRGEEFTEGRMGSGTRGRAGSEGEAGASSAGIRLVKSKLSGGGFWDIASTNAKELVEAPRLTIHAGDRGIWGGEAAGGLEHAGRQSQASSWIEADTVSGWRSEMRS